MATHPVTVVLVSSDEPARAVIAAAYIKTILGPSVDLRSFGSEPSESIDPFIETVMNEEGIFLENARPTPLDPAILARADRIVTIGLDPATAARIPRVDEDWTVPDPEGRPIAEIRAIRDEIKRRVLGLAGALLRGEAGTVAAMAYAEGLVPRPSG